MQKSIYCRRRLCLLAGIVCIMLLPAAQFSSYFYSIPLDEITDMEIIFPAAVVDHEVAVRKVASAYPRAVQFEWAENDAEKWPAIYWVRELQEDGATAWPSPIFVEE